MQQSNLIIILLLSVCFTSCTGEKQSSHEESFLNDCSASVEQEEDWNYVLRYFRSVTNIQEFECQVYAADHSLEALLYQRLTLRYSEFKKDIIEENMDSIPPENCWNSPSQKCLNETEFSHLETDYYIIPSRLVYSNNKNLCMILFGFYNVHQDLYGEKFIIFKRISGNQYTNWKMTTAEAVYPFGQPVFPPLND